MQEKIGKVRWFFRGILITLMIINSAYGQVRQRGKYKFRHENLTLEQIQTIYRDTSKFGVIQTQTFFSKRTAKSGD